MKIIHWQALDEGAQEKLLARPAQAISASIAQTVQSIGMRVRIEGDAALFEFAEQFDGVALDALQISEAAIAQACTRVPEALKAAILTAKENIERFHMAQKSAPVDVQVQQGVRCQVLTRAIEKVGLYIPGGSAPLFSTVLMLALPAKIAGCQKIVLCSPAPVSDEILYTAWLCGVKTVYAVGGAGAVFALAYGTQSIEKVDKIFGPGNAFVTEAKRQVLADGVAIDMPAGPSEVLVIADEQADAGFVASDLLSQAEHGADSQVVLLTPSETLAQAVGDAIKAQLAHLSRKEIAEKALLHSRLIVTKDLAQCFALSNRYAPEHLIVQTQNPRQWLAEIVHAGSIFLGAYSPESMGDYASGTNHVLPTYGFARTHSSLGLADFSKRMTVQELTEQGFLTLAPAVMAMAQAEQLQAHAQAVRLRVEALRDSLGS